MQLLIQIDTPDYGAWKSAWDADAEDRADSGLTQMQIWKGEGGKAFVLLDVHNVKGAKDWLAKEQAFGGVMTPHFLETA
ncbi:hypothetical protein QCN27_06065 [Cereibacter sp. SYSU M97828]|nr:hypothetical protein [Cereibacter flavus]